MLSVDVQLPSCFPGRSRPRAVDGGEASTLQEAKQEEKGPAAPRSMSLSPVACLQPAQPLLDSTAPLNTNSHWILQPVQAIAPPHPQIAGFPPSSFRDSPHPGSPVALPPSPNTLTNLRSESE